MLTFWWFSDLLNQYNVDMPPQEFDSIITKYDIKENGRFCYSEFLRHFMISMRPKDGTAVTARRKLQPLKVPVSCYCLGVFLLVFVVIITLYMALMGDRVAQLVEHWTGVQRTEV